MRVMRGKNRVPHVYHIFAHTLYLESMGELGSINHGVDNWYICSVAALNGKQARNWAWMHKREIKDETWDYAEFTDMRAKLSDGDAEVWEKDKELPYLYDWPPMTEEEEQKIVKELEQIGW